MTSDINDLEAGSTIDLASEPPFVLGRVSVRPAFRQLVRADDGAEELVEPRVMQVLVALARAGGAIVTRDSLVRDCWDGRIVGEDAINRALSRLRRLAEGIGRDSFRLETVTKVGYRLVAGDGASDGATGAAPAEAGPGRWSRRSLVVGGGTAALLAGGAAWLALRPSARHSNYPSPEIERLMEQAVIALHQDTREGHNQAIGLYRQIVAVDPNYADGWGALGYAYTVAAIYRSRDEGAALRERAKAAGRRSLALEPGNGYGQVAVAAAVPLRGWWLELEQALRRAVAQHPDNEQLLSALLGLLLMVGRIREALPLVERMESLMPQTPNLLFNHITMLWNVDRMEECDRMMAEAAAIYPTHFAIWFTRFYILMFSGRPAAAIALAEDRQQRPTGIAESEFDSIVRVARAMESRIPAEVDAVVEEQMVHAHEGAGLAENAIQFMSALGRVDTAFTVAEAYYFGRGFAVPELRFSKEQGSYTAMGDRLTGFLFKPSTRAMRADRRFAGLVGELGLERYWQRSGARPDYLG